jgi:hypothetical protein
MEGRHRDGLLPPLHLPWKLSVFGGINSRFPSAIIYFYTVFFSRLQFGTGSNGYNC